MEIKTFKKTDLLIGWVVFAISAVVYLASIEPTASFWDCGEFIASSYKLEVGHPPGNPTYQLFGRLFSLFGNGQQAAWLINAMSALASAFVSCCSFGPFPILAEGCWKHSAFPGLGQRGCCMGAAAVGSLVYSFQIRPGFLQ